MDSIAWLIRPPTRDHSTTGIEAPSPGSQVSRSTDYSQKPDFSLRTPSRNSASTDQTSYLQARTYSRSSRSTQRTAIVDATVQCPICFDSMTTPKTLPCLHNVCKRCLKQYILTHLRKELQNNIEVQTFPCPVCKEDIGPPEPTADYEKWASMFPTNFFLHAYGMILTVQREEVNCDSCTRRGESTLASWWCRECSEYMCNVCKTVHGGFKIFQDHEVKSVNDIAENPDIAIPKADSCTEHREKITHFCRGHRMPTCNTCLVTSHRKCDSVVYIEEEFKLLKDRGEISKLEITLREYEEMTMELIMNRNKLIKDLEVKKKEIINQIKQIREDFEESLKKLETKLLEDFDKFHDSEIKNLEKLVSQSENLCKQISNAIKLVDTVQQSGSGSHMVALMGRINRECKKYKKAIKDGQSELQDVTYEFQIDNLLKQTLKSVKHIGNIKLKRSSVAPEAVIAGSYNSQDVYKVREVKELRVWIAGDRGRCGIVGGIYFDDNRILLADHDNFKLKLFNEQGRPVSNLVLKKKPTDITMITGGKFIMTYPAASAVQFIRLEENSFQEGPCINTPRIYFSVACHDKNLFFLSKTGISISDLEAKEMRFIKPEEYGGSAILGQGHIKVMSEGFVVTDQDKHTITLYTPDGVQTHTFMSKEIKLPTGCDVDLHGNIFVCCQNSASVFQCNSDGITTRILLSAKDGLDNPAVICLQKQKNKFFIVDNKISKRNYIRIYEWI